MKNERHFWTLLVIAVVVLLFNVSMPLTDGDTALYARIAKNILKTGDWMTLRDPSMPIFDKPPLTIWPIAVSYKLLGYTNIAVRLWHSLLGVCMVLLTFALTRLVYPRRTSFTAGTILLSSVLLLYTSMVPQQDVPVTLSYMAVFYCFLRFVLQGGLGYFYLMWASVGLALMTRGVSAIIYPLGTLFLFLFILRRSPHTYFNSGWRGFFKHILGGFAIFALVGLPWYLYEFSVLGKPFLDVFLNTNRYQTTLKAGTFDYIPLLIVAFLPWTAFVIPAIRKNLADIRSGDNHSRIFAQFMLVWFITAFLFPHTAVWRVIRYLLPCLPPLAIMTSAFLTPALERGWTSLQDREKKGLMQGAIFSLVLMLPILLITVAVFTNKLPADAKPYLTMISVFLGLIALGVISLVIGVMSKRPAHGVYGLFGFTLVAWVTLVSMHTVNLTDQVRLVEKADSRLKANDPLYSIAGDYHWFYSFYSTHKVTPMESIDSIAEVQRPALAILNSAAASSQLEGKELLVLGKTRMGDVLVEVR